MVNPRSPFFSSTHLSLSTISLLLILSNSSSPPPFLPPPQPEIHRHGDQQPKAQHRRAEPIVVPRRPPLAHHLHPPQIEHQAVDERQARDDGEPPRRRERDCVVPEVHERGRDRAEDDGELQPGEEGALGREVDFGLDPHGHVDPWVEWLAAYEGDHFVNG